MDEFMEFEGISAFDESRMKFAGKTQFYIRLSKNTILEEFLEKEADLNQINTFAEAIEYILKDSSYFPKKQGLYFELRENYNSSGNGNVFLVSVINENGMKDQVDVNENIVRHIKNLDKKEVLDLEAQFIPGLGGK